MPYGVSPDGQYLYVVKSATVMRNRPNFWMRPKRAGHGTTEAAPYARAYQGPILEEVIYIS